MTPASRLRSALRIWAWLGLAVFALLPWYFLQDRSLLSALPEVWQGPDTASALVQAQRHGRPWLWTGSAGLLLCLLGLLLPLGARCSCGGADQGPARAGGQEWCGRVRIGSVRVGSPALARPRELVGRGCGACRV